MWCFAGASICALIGFVPVHFPGAPDDRSLQETGFPLVKVKFEKSFSFKDQCVGYEMTAQPWRLEES